MARLGTTMSKRSIIEAAIMFLCQSKCSTISAYLVTVRQGVKIFQSRRSISSSSSVFSRVERKDDGTIFVLPSESEDKDDLDRRRHSASVILCHGLGDTAEGWLEPARYLSSKLPHIKFILPTARTQPVTINMGLSMPSWYDIQNLNDKDSCRGLDESVSRILDMVEEEVRESRLETTTTSTTTTTTILEDEKSSAAANTAVPVDGYSRIVLAGFSQGGALALYAGMTSFRTSQDNTFSKSQQGQQNQPQYAGLGLAGIVVMSGYLPRSDSFKIAPGSQSTPILHCHGELDPIVAVEAAAKSRNCVTFLMQKMGETNASDLYQVKTFPRLDHSVSLEEMDEVAKFLQSVLPPNK